MNRLDFFESVSGRSHLIINFNKDVSPYLRTGIGHHKKIKENMKKKKEVNGFAYESSYIMGLSAFLFDHEILHIITELSIRKKAANFIQKKPTSPPRNFSMGI